MLHQRGQLWFNSALRTRSGETVNSSHRRYRMLGKHLQGRSAREQTFPISEATPPQLPPPLPPRSLDLIKKDFRVSECSPRYFKNDPPLC